MDQTTIAVGTERNMYGALVQLVYQIAMLIGSGRHDEISVADVCAHHRAGDLLLGMKSLDPRFDISIFGDRGIYVLELRGWLEGLDRQFNATVPEDYGTEQRGLCYLFVLTVDQLRGELERLMQSYDKRIAEAAQAVSQADPRRKPQKH